MKNKTIWLRIACWTGAIIDALAALLLTFPGLNAWFSGFAAVDPSPAFRSANAQAAALMWGWTLLLLWAGRRPLERRGVLALTLFPVLFILTGARGAEMLFYRGSFAYHFPVLILLISLIALLSYSLWVNRAEGPTPKRILF